MLLPVGAISGSKFSQNTHAKMVEEIVLKNESMTSGSSLCFYDKKHSRKILPLGI